LETELYWPGRATGAFMAMQLVQNFTVEMIELNQQLGSDFAIISSITGKDYEVLAVASKLDTVKKGAIYDIHNTYCEQVINDQDLVMYTQVGTIRAMTLHPVYTAMQLEAYIGEPLFKDGVIVGTLNFSGFLPKRPAYSKTEIENVKALARKVENALVDLGGSG
jgi:GAF domain-containing protein